MICFSMATYAVVRAARSGLARGVGATGALRRVGAVHRDRRVLGFGRDLLAVDRLHDRLAELAVAVLRVGDVDGEEALGGNGAGLHDAELARVLDRLPGGHSR